MENINTNNLATKDDINLLKDDVGILKDDLNKLDKKVNKVFWHLDKKIDNTKNDLENRMNFQFNEVSKSNDQQIRLLNKIDHELASHSKSYQDHQIVLDDHEQRIQILEPKLAV